VAARVEHRIADLVAPTLRGAVLTAIGRLERAMPLTRVAEAVERDRPETVVQTIDWHGIRDGLTEDLLVGYRVGVADAGDASAKLVPVSRLRKADRLVSEFGFSFSITNPRVTQWLRDVARITAINLSSEAVNTVRSMLLRMFREGVPPVQAARLIRDTVGLHPRYATAVVNFRNDLVARGFTPDYIDKKVATYARRLKQHRAETIARTESIRAAAQGQQEAWDQMVAQGILDSNEARKEWMVAEDERLCEICAPLQGWQVPIDQTFPVQNGIPPAHPNCRCAVRLVFADAEGRFRSKGPATPGNPPKRTLRPRVKRTP